MSGFFGSSELEVGSIQVGNAATFSGNSAVPGGVLEFNDNTIAPRRDLLEEHAVDHGRSPDDGPNQVGGENNGCP